MANVYVGPSSAGAADGTSWANRYGTLNAAEDRPLSAGDTVYVGPGTYRELLTVDVSGSVGSPITYIGDYTGASTDGVGGVVRVTGLNTDTGTPARSYCITATTRSYRTFSGLVFDGVSLAHVLLSTGCANVIIDKCVFGAATVPNSVGSAGVYIDGAAQSTNTVKNCVFVGPYAAPDIWFTHSSTVDNSAHVVQSCVFLGGGAGVGLRVDRVGGVTVKNVRCMGRRSASIRVVTALTVGQTLTVNNSIIVGQSIALQATTSAEFAENYNLIFGCDTARSNVSAGANSVAYHDHVDPRPWLEAMHGGTMVLPFDLASYAGLVELNSGTGAPSTDLRGASATGTYREWGPLEYNAALAIEAGGGVTMWPLSSSFIGTILGAQ